MQRESQKQRARAGQVWRSHTVYDRDHDRTDESCVEHSKFLCKSFNGKMKNSRSNNLAFKSLTIALNSVESLFQPTQR